MRNMRPNAYKIRRVADIHRPLLMRQVHRRTLWSPWRTRIGAAIKTQESGLNSVRDYEHLTLFILCCMSHGTIWPTAGFTGY